MTRASLQKINHAGKKKGSGEILSMGGSLDYHPEELLPGDNLNCRP